MQDEKKPLIVRNKKPSFWNALPRIFTMMKSYRNKEYKNFPVATTAALGIFLIYLLVPLDFLPDTLPFVGVIDDSVIFALFMILSEIDLSKFQQWRDSQEERLESDEVISEDVDVAEVVDEEETSEKKELQ